MDIWNNYLKKADKKRKKQTGYDYNPEANVEGKKLVLKETETCDKCETETNHTITVEFYEKPERITIFQAGVIYSIVALEEIPRDYAEFHESKAGKEFIGNIKYIHSTSHKE